MIWSNTHLGQDYTDVLDVTVLVAGLGEGELGDIGPARPGEFVELCGCQRERTSRKGVND